MNQEVFSFIVLVFYFLGHMWMSPHRPTPDLAWAQGPLSGLRFTIGFTWDQLELIPIVNVTPIVSHKLRRSRQSAYLKVRRYSSNFARHHYGEQTKDHLSDKWRHTNSTYTTRNRSCLFTLLPPWMPELLIWYGGLCNLYMFRVIEIWNDWTQLTGQLNCPCGLMRGYRA